MKTLRRAHRAFGIEVLAIWYAFRDPRIRWHGKILLALPVIYVASPFDLVNDAVPFWGQVDDLVVLRLSYLLIRKLLPADVLADGRERAQSLWDGGGTNRVLFWAAVTVIWSFALFVLGRYLLRKIVKHA